MKRLTPVWLLIALAWTQPGLAQSCTVTSAAASTLVDFGIYTALGGPLDGVGTIDLSCTPGALLLPVSYSISIGAGASGSFNPRKFLAGAYALDYNLYLDILRLQIWGDGSAGTGKHGGACSGACPVTVYGRIFGNQSPPAAAYSDEVLITLDF
jgi:spore coat protein U-like protein